jgi:hypothetical protein
VRVLIDTMVLIWAVHQPARLSHRAARTLRNPRSTNAAESALHERCGIRAARWS